MALGNLCRIVLKIDFGSYLIEFASYSQIDIQFILFWLLKSEDVSFNCCFSTSLKGSKGFQLFHNFSHNIYLRFQVAAWDFIFWSCFANWRELLLESGIRRCINKHYVSSVLSFASNLVDFYVEDTLILSVQLKIKLLTKIFCSCFVCRPRQKHSTSVGRVKVAELKDGKNYLSLVFQRALGAGKCFLVREAASLLCSMRKINAFAVRGMIENCY